MRLLRLLPERWHSLAREIAKFGIVGGLNTVVDFAVFYPLMTIGPVKANVISTVVATASSYAMNRHWTYRERAKDAVRRELVLFLAFNAVGLVIQSAVIGAAKYGLGFDEHHDKLELNIAKALGIGVAMVFRFWAYRSFVFRLAPAGQDLPVAEQAALAITDATPSMAEDTSTEAHHQVAAPAERPTARRRRHPVQRPSEPTLDPVPRP